MKTLILIIAALVLSSIAYSEVDEDCLAEPLYSVIGPTYTYSDEFFEEYMYNVNAGKVRLDTCHSTPGNWIYYGKFFDIYFSLNIFPRDTVFEYDEDSLFKYIRYYPKDLQPQYQYLSDELDSIQSMFGDYYFVDFMTLVPDTTEMRPLRRLKLHFEEYESVDSIFTKIMQFDFVDTLTWEMPVVISSVGDDYQNKTFVYPNPSVNTLQIESNLVVSSIKIIDYSGNEIKSIQGMALKTVNIEDLPTGTYFIIINNKYSHKFIKE